MTPREYLELSATTASPESHDLAHYVLGIASEAGEIADILKAHHAYGKDLDREHLLEEIGDLNWYVANLLRLLDSDFETVWSQNIAKLKSRYPEGFKKKDALDRDREAERQAMRQERPEDS